MNVRKFKLIDIFSISCTVLLASWGYILSETKQKKGLFYDLIRYFDNIIPITIGLIIIILYIWKIAKDDLPKKSVLRFLNLVHEKHFSHPDGGLHPDYRVTLFKPMAWNKLCFEKPIIQRFLKFYARSGGTYPKSKVKWSITHSENERFDGITGFAWVNDFVVAYDDLPDYTIEPKQYCVLTHITEEKAKKVRWHARSFRATVLKNKKGEKVGVLMMESVHPEGLKQIKPSTLREESRYFQIFFSD